MESALRFHMLAFTLALAAIIAVWAMYKTIVYALPFLVGLGIASVAFDTGAGWVGATLTGLGTAVSCFFLLRFLLARVRSRALRCALAAVLALPSAVLAYEVGLDALASGVAHETWRHALSIVFALVISAIAFNRLTQSETIDP
jgi:hypothetical protein